MKKKIPIGVSDFKKIIEEGYHYVDKSLFIKEIIEDGSEVILLPRPRRFGKTLNMTMLRYFFEKTKEDNGILFHGLKIWQHEDIAKEQGKRPVIYLTLKDIKCNNWEECLSSFEIQLSYLYGEHRYLLDGIILKDNEKKSYEDIIWKRSNVSELGNTLRNLCEFLHRYYGENPIILIDEYDTPIYSAWTNGYYDELISFIRSLLGRALKDNKFLGKAVLTGIMRIAKESIFSGLNNLNVATIIQKQYNDKFGFLEDEVEGFMVDCNIEYEMPEVRSWYNGYVFGDKIIYNPWSIINYAQKHEDGLKPYWVNTGSSDIIRDMLTVADQNVKLELEDLILGKELIKDIREDTVLADIENSPETLWSFLLFSGYLKATETWQDDKKTKCKLKIPNKEVEYVFEEIIRYWTSRGVGEHNFKLMLKSLTIGDFDTFEEIFSQQVEDGLSYFDVGGKEPERFYHAFVLGMLLNTSKEYQLKSNRESGHGRYDILLIPKDREKNGVIIEFKKVSRVRKERLEAACEAALKQIEDKGYRRELEAMGISKVVEVGIAFEGKQVMVKGRYNNM